ncbi:chromate transporter [Niveibacterium sp. 24ML]|uniref:chromate transporter n=1 Tax=Niveibacterium sp. 24ML TaxID=2985512 RepID=UPI002270DE14|nr:chromate transporter [Niveibacterium sp. 24ML]MCX9155720.1 chromate transporter [Niveibacterium sp. 24ML]
MSNAAAPSLGELLLGCATLSLVAVGGANAIVPELHRQVVDIHRWLSGPEFATLFAIAATAPGPNVLVVTLIGWKLGGIPGALLATAGICGPSSVLAFTVGKAWERLRASPGRQALERGLAPVTIGLVLGSGWLLNAAAATDWRGWLVAGVAAAAYWRARFNPLWVLAGAALLGAFLLS